MTKRDRPETPTDRRRAERAQAEDEYAAEQMAIDKLFAAALDNEPGKLLRAYLLNAVINRPVPHDMPDGALRGWLGQRSAAQEIETRIARFRKKGAQS